MSLRHALLGLLVERSGSGYDLMKLFDTSLAHVWPATQSQVYGELNRLEGNGLIQVVAEGPRGRKEYGITESGTKELRQWLAEGYDDKPQRSEALLRVFFLGVLSRQQAVDRLLNMAEVAAERHAVMKGVNEAVDWGSDMLSVNGRLALEYGLRLRAMEEEWARWAAERVSSGAQDENAEASGPRGAESSGADV
ncbi:PadR family transcriptional regulator [Streptomyces camponoticapitis]|uniref:PadR family transcriptional regulator n=1 Tax=Streptomyces camponoticapitis TaxID=1616125 RepID=A0ABQ2E2W7_9ACTN|nr:PadR family transcriptional regulator [Streptomyces camponoticapitis]GGJ84305.1 PadR family transcriptional regulator [Streptomyces camponoticapitis]